MLSKRNQWVKWNWKKIEKEGSKNKKCKITGYHKIRPNPTRPRPKN